MVTSEADQKSLTVFKASFDTMEMNSARRSSDAEHQLITKLLQRTLQRQGICNTIRYDIRTARPDLAWLMPIEHAFGFMMKKRNATTNRKQLTPIGVKAWGSRRA